MLVDRLAEAQPPPPEAANGTIERQRTVHNERVKLNATFFNNLAV